MIVLFGKAIVAFIQASFNHAVKGGHLPIHRLHIWAKSLEVTQNNIFPAQANFLTKEVRLNENLVGK